MEYQEFIQNITNRIQAILGDQYQVVCHPVCKNNGVYLDGLIITSKETNISPSIYLNQYYDQFVVGRPMSEIYDEITGQFEPRYMAETDFEFDPERKPGILKTLMEDRLVPDFTASVVDVSYTDGCKVYFDNGWIIARFSGTEPLLRIYCEMPDQEQAERACEEFRQFLAL